jgi:hypothetical protein
MKDTLIKTAENERDGLRAEIYFNAGIYRVIYIDADARDNADDCDGIVGVALYRRELDARYAADAFTY